MSDTGDNNNKKKFFTRADIKGYVIFAVCMVLTAAIVFGVLSLVRGKNTRTSIETDNGLARSFMFPFAFTDQTGSLYVLEDDKLTVTPVDDSVENAVHAASAGDIYYLRKGVLYVYDIGRRERKIVAENVAGFEISGSGAFTLCIMQNRALKLYNGKNLLDISEGPEEYNGEFYSIGTDYVLFAANIDAAAGTADLVRADARGGTKTVAQGISTAAGFSFASSDKYIRYSKNGELCIADIAGKQICSLAGGELIAETSSASILEPCTATVNYDENAALRYVYTNVDGQNRLYYFNGSSLKQIEENVRRVVYFSMEENLIIYTVPENGSERLVRGGKSGKTEALITIPENTRCIYEAESDYLYYQLADGTLMRVNIYSSALKEEKVADNTGNVYNYPQKPFIIYNAPDSNTVYLVDRSGPVASYNSAESVLLYGYSDNNYLMLRSYGYEKLSLDGVKSGLYTRISSDVDNSIFFDSNLDYVLYTSGSTLYLWNGTANSEVGEYGRISAIPCTGGGGN